MSTKFKINIFFRVAFTLFVLFMTVFYVWDIAQNPIEKHQTVFLLILWWSLIPLFFSYIKVTDDKIQVLRVFVPKLWVVQRNCAYEDISYIEYKFLLFEEFGFFRLVSKNGASCVEIHFLIDGKKLIIDKIREKRPDLELNNWINEKVLNYRVVSLKFLLIAFVIIFMCVLLLVFQWLV